MTDRAPTTDVVDDACVQRARESFARIAGVPVEWVAVAAQASYLVGVVAASLEPGSEVGSCRNELTVAFHLYNTRADVDLVLRAAAEPA